MKTFAFRVYARGGERTRGLIEAMDLKEAREKLAARGVLAETLNPAGSHGGRRRFGSADRSSLYRELGSLLSSGVPAVAALDILLEAQPREHVAALLAAVRDALREGAGFAQALPSACPDITSFESALLLTGQRTGQLGAVMAQMADYLDEQRRLRESIQSALLYPMLVIGLSLIVGVVMMLVVLPRLTNLFEETGAQLPWLTRALLWVGGPGRIPVLGVLALVVGGVWWSVRGLRRTPESRVAWEQRWMRWPLIGVAFRHVVSVRFTRTLVVLLRGGVPLVEGLPLAARASGSLWLDQEMQRGAETVRQGRPVAAALADAPWVGATLPPWYRAGEASGDLNGMLEQAARRFQEQWETLLQRVVRLMEPALILMVGVFVLLIALAILMPLLSLNQTAF